MKFALAVSIVFSSLVAGVSVSAASTGTLLDTDDTRNGLPQEKTSGNHRDLLQNVAVNAAHKPQAQDDNPEVPPPPPAPGKLRRELGTLTANGSNCKQFGSQCECSVNKEWYSNLGYKQRLVLRNKCDGKKVYAFVRYFEHKNENTISGPFQVGVLLDPSESKNLPGDPFMGVDCVQVYTYACTLQSVSTGACHGWTPLGGWETYDCSGSNASCSAFNIQYDIEC